MAFGTTTTPTISSVVFGTGAVPVTALSLLTSEPMNNVGTNGTLFHYGGFVPGGTDTVTVTYGAAVKSIGNSVTYLNVGSYTALTPAFGATATASLTATASRPLVMIVNSLAMTAVIGAMSSLSGGTNRYNSFGNATALTISDALATTTFSAAAGAAHTWAGVAVQLNPTLI